MYLLNLGDFESFRSVVDTLKPIRICDVKLLPFRVILKDRSSTPSRDSIDMSDNTSSEKEKEAVRNKGEGLSMLQRPVSCVNSRPFPRRTVANKSGLLLLLHPLSSISGAICWY